MKTYFIVPGPSNWASTRLRARWIVDNLPGSQGVWEHQEIPLDGDAYIWIKHIRLDIMERVKSQGGQNWYDVCDPVHWFSPDALKEALPYFTGIVTSNDNLTVDFRKFLRQETDYPDMPVHTVIDRLNFDHFPKQRRHIQADPIRFIWFGASQNRSAIWAGIDLLRWLKARGINVELTVYDDMPNTHWEIDAGLIPVYATLWRLEQENEIIASHDIALLPPHPGKWGTIKSNNKTITALACGLPVSNGSDFEHAMNLCKSAELRQREVADNYDDLHRLYDVRLSAEEWKALLNG